MSKYERKTHDEWHIQANYGGVAGWETVTIEDNMADAKRMLADYNENERNYPHRIVKKRVRNS